MRDDLFCFTFMGHRVCVMLDDSLEPGWSYCIDAGPVPPLPEKISYAQRMLLQEAGLAARDRIRAGRPGNRFAAHADAQHAPHGPHEPAEAVTTA